MKKLLFLCIFLPIFAVTACESESLEQKNTEVNQNEDQGDNMETDKITLTIGNNTFTVTLIDNSSVKMLKELLTKSDISIDMRDYGNMEKVGLLGVTLPTNDEYITTSIGDIILYQGNQLVIYYASNTYSFTRLGKIDNVSSEDLLSALGDGNITITLSID